jgi:CelD/BcsL family acetyltransferase involved in cellulose biosynthesis
MIHFRVFENINQDLIDNLNYIKKKTSHYIFQSPEWIYVAASNLNNFDKLKIVFIYNHNDIILVAPFYIRTIYGCKELCWLSSDIIDYNNVIISDFFNYEDYNFKKLWKKIIKDLSNECDLVFFNKNPELITYLNNPLIDAQYKYYQKSYQLNLKGFDYESFYNNKNNNKSIQTDRRKNKKLHEDSDLIYSYEDIDLTNFKLVEELIFEKMSSYQSNKKKSFDYKNIVDQYKKLVSYNNSNYKFNLSILKKNGVKISSILGVIFNGIYYYLIPVVNNTDYKKLSPGRFHIINLIKWAMKNNIRSIDFTAGDEPYKNNWSNNEFKMFYYFNPLTLKGTVRCFFLNLYYKYRKNTLFKKIYYYIRYEI